MKHTLSLIAFLAPLLQVWAVPMNFIQRAVDDSNSSPLSAVAENTWVQSGVLASTVRAPELWNGYRFTRWTISTLPSVSMRDPWGRSMNPAQFTITTRTTATVHYLSASLDADADEVPDWFEMEYYGHLSHAALTDTDGDGRGLLAEHRTGSNPLMGDYYQPGGVSVAQSGLVTVNLAGYASYRLRSEPAGAINETNVAPPGTVVNTPEITQSNFGYWAVDGVQQRDAWGVALRRVSFVMGAVDREAVAWFFNGDSDGDGLDDAWEYYHLSGLNYGATNDINGDGFSLWQEFQSGRSPVLGYSFQPGGVSRGDSALVTVNLAGYPRYTLRSEPAGLVNESQIAPPGAVVTTPEMTATNFGYWMLDGVKQRDAWGVALRRVSFVMGAVDREVVAWFFASDSDSDGIDDAWEHYYLNGLSYGATNDPNGDGFTLLQEFQSGRNPSLGYSYQPGGVSRSDSVLVTVDLTELPFYTLRSEPVGIIYESRRARLGSTVTTPMVTNNSFGYWTLDGVEQRDAQGVALRQLAFVMGYSNRLAVAWFFEGDADGNGIPDAWEHRLFGRLLGFMFSDADGDGQRDRTEILAGTGAFDPDDFFHVHSVGMSGSRAQLRWMPNEGVAYRVLFSTNMINWHTLGDYTLSQQGGESIVTDRSPSGSQRFYTIEILE